MLKKLELNVAPFLLNPIAKALDELGLGRVTSSDVLNVDRGE